MEKEKYVLGLDIGISSIGWALLKMDENNNPIRIKDAGVKIFSPGEDVKTGESKALDRRSKRGTRRIIRRREHRLNRVRYLLSEYGLMDKSDKVVLSDIYDDLKDKYNDLINNYYNGKDINPFILRKEGLERKLNSDELAIILIHYAKKRGYKSNRQDETSDNDQGKVKESINKNYKLLHEKKYRTISEMFVVDSEFTDRIHNTTNNYKMSVSREMTLDDIIQVLDNQIKYGLITDKFKNEYIKIWSSQRHYAKGPGGNSIYGGDLIKRMTGVCKFTGEPRAPKCAPSNEIFVALTSLVNLKYKSNVDETYKSLTSNQINDILLLAYTKDNVTYKNIANLLGVDNIIIKGLELTKKEFTDALVLFKTKILKLDKNNKERIDFEELSEEYIKAFEELKNDKILSKKFIELKTLSLFRKKFSSAFGNDRWNYLLENINILDDIATILTDYKVDEDIEKAIGESDTIDEDYTELILNDLGTLKDHSNLSLTLIRKLIPLMKSGKLYNEAMDELGYNFSDLTIDNVKNDLLIPINIKNDIKNQRVIRSLSQSRKIINSIIKKYGMPYKINIETAGELAKNKKERSDIEKKQKANKENNERIKGELVKLLPSKFKDISKVSSFSLTKYKLWLEQNNLCAYSLTNISIEELFDDNLVQIDHILPYSRTFNDSYFNKTLVKSKYNQEKGNRTPHEWIKSKDKWDEFKTYINSLNISQTKKDNYLLVKLTPEIENDMRNQNLNDTKYITRYLTSFLKAYLNVPIVDSVNGSITSKLRTRWGFNNLTHSLQSKSYYLKDDDINNETVKNRENHLHHVMDACIIACTNRSLIQSITKYEKFRRYFDNKTSADIESLIRNEYIYKDEKNDIFFDSETGEVVDTGSLKEYIKEIRDKEYLKVNNRHLNQLMFPLPYPEFHQELKTRIFERDINQMKFTLNGLKNYSKNDIEECKPIIPVQTKPKISGPLHEETFYGYKVDNDGNEFTTSRISVISSSFNFKKLETLVDKNGGASEVYNTLIKWLGKYPDGETAFKEKGYPKDKTGKLIKRIKTQSSYDGKGHIIKGKIAAKTNVIKIEVFKDKNSDNLYFIGLDQYDIINIKKNKNYLLTLWMSTGQNERNSFNNFSIKYEHYLSLTKNNLIKLVKNDGRSSYCYVVGFSDGKIEIGSVLGDSYDLVGNTSLFNDFYSGGQYPITITTIKSIEKIKLTTLGKIE